MSSYPRQRPRRLRSTVAMRRLVAQTSLEPRHLVLPMFVADGIDEPRPITSMPGVVQHTRDSLRRAAAAAVSWWLGGLMLFGVPRASAGAGVGCSVLSPAGLLRFSVRDLWRGLGEATVLMADTCLDEFTDHGHCGVFAGGGLVGRFGPVAVSVDLAVAQAESGAHVVGPSGMMDGQVAAIRDGLDAAGYIDVVILGFSSTFASAFYGPFREAVSSSLSGDRCGSGVGPWRAADGLRLVGLGVGGGAVLVLVSGAMGYLDVVAAWWGVFRVLVGASVVLWCCWVLRGGAGAVCVGEGGAVVVSLRGVGRVFVCLVFACCGVGFAGLLAWGVRDLRGPGGLPPSLLFCGRGAGWWWVVAGPLAVVLVVVLGLFRGAGVGLVGPAVFLVLVCGLVALLVRGGGVGASVALSGDVLLWCLAAVVVGALVILSGYCGCFWTSVVARAGWASARTLGWLVGVRWGRLGFGVPLSGWVGASALVCGLAQVRAALFRLFAEWLWPVASCLLGVCCGGACAALCSAAAGAGSSCSWVVPRLLCLLGGGLVLGAAWGWFPCCGVGRLVCRCCLGGVGWCWACWLRRWRAFCGWWGLAGCGAGGLACPLVRTACRGVRRGVGVLCLFGCLRSAAGFWFPGVCRVGLVVSKVCSIRCGGACLHRRRSLILMSGLNAMLRGPRGCRRRSSIGSARRLGPKTGPLRRSWWRWGSCSPIGGRVAGAARSG
ncbi:hypothetical protein P950_03009 [Mycobacterium tuberculosis KT-0057]|nr:hypothetical protein P950_03009 [Mycobacterium tuberculosis KT-0057]